MMAKPNKTGAPVSERALLARVNRRLAGEGRMLKVARGEAARREMGTYFLVDFGENAVVNKNVSLAKLGHKMGLLRPWERMVEP